jgi:succinyl-diaminopimelate desuccinylase
MLNGKSQILAWIEADRSRLIGFLQEFLRIKTPNPPGDTRAAGEFLTRFLNEEQLSHRVIVAHPEMPNVVASFDGRRAGKHLVLNGHMDVFPVEQGEVWAHGPWSGDLADACVWGRGAVDMKCGTTASIFAYIYLNRLRSDLKGRLTLTVVSDEETFGPYGTRYLMEYHPEIHGDCCISGEPSDPRTIRFGEKGPLWLRFKVHTSGGHGAYPHVSKSATKIAASIIEEVQTLEVEVAAPGNAGPILAASAEVVEAALGKGAKEVIQKITTNPGLIRGGVKVNMIPASCMFEMDIRLPIGCSKDDVLARIDSIVSRYPEASYEAFNYSGPNWCDPAHEMVGIIRNNVKALANYDPQPIVGLGATDMRLWRERGIPAFVYGPSPETMGKRDERVAVDEFLHIVRTHACSAYDYLAGNT